MPTTPETRVVIVDEWPMIRIGLAKVLAMITIRTVAEFSDVSGVPGAVRTHGAQLLVIGNHAGVTADVVRKVVALEPRPRTVVLLSSPRADEVRELLAAGVDGALTRGVTPEEFIAAVQRVLAGERVVSPALLSLMFDVRTRADGQTGRGGPSIGPDGVVVSEPAGLAADPDLTIKEREVVRLLAAGGSNAAIANELFVSEATVKTHLAHVYAKLGVKGRHEAVARAVSLGIVA